MQLVHLSEVIHHKTSFTQEVLFLFHDNTHTHTNLFSLKAVCIHLSYMISKPIFTLKLSNKYVKMSIMFKNGDKYAASRPGGTL